MDYTFDARSQLAIVTGLPRAGTSMLMQMVAAGGVPVFSDAFREADEDNPSGYLEHEAVKRLASDASWLPEVRGRVIKIVAPLIPSLPQGLEASVLLVERDLDEVLRSQEKMMQRLGTKGAALPADRLKTVFAQQLARAKTFLSDQRGVTVLDLSYAEVVHDPVAAAAAISSFLGGELDESAMAAAVDPTLYRNRAN